MDDTLTLALDGQVTLDDFAKAVSSFRSLVAEISRSVTGGEEITWEVADLQAGSAVAAVRGLGPDAQIEQVVRTFERVGSAFEAGSDSELPANIRREAKGLVSLINGRIESIRFETAREEHLIRNRPADAIPVVVAFPRRAYGAVRGTIETLSRRGGLKFTLYDLLHKRAVSCYLPAGSASESIMRDAWGQAALVYGMVNRDPETGRALSIRNVSKVETLEPAGPGAWQRARGAVPPDDDDVSPEAAIRLIRDA